MCRKYALTVVHGVKKNEPIIVMKLPHCVAREAHHILKRQLVCGGKPRAEPHLYETKLRKKV